MFRDKETKSKSDNQIHELVTPLSDFSGTTKAPDLVEKAPIGISRVTMPTATIAARDKLDSKNAAQTETKRLTVGRGISLNGKVSSCDRLIIEGTVEAELENCQTVEVTESGTFKGAAEIGGAEISGQYEGSLTVRDTLLIRAMGRVSGTVRYGRLQIEDGGEINGDVKSAAAASPKLRSVTGN
jgi:cytoskeletal protein CcmA (bactofilin family)